MGNRIYTYEYNSVLKFGKHKGKTIEWVIKNDIGWIKYQYEQNPHFMLGPLAHVDYLEAAKDRRNLRVGSAWKGGNRRTHY